MSAEPTTREAAAALGLRILPSTGDHLDRRTVVYASTGEVVIERALPQDIWSRYHANQRSN